MSSSQKQRKTQLLPGQQPGSDAPQHQETLPEFDRMVESGEISPDVAEHLVPQLGNEAVLALLNQSGASELSTAALDQEEEEVVDLDEEHGELEVEVKALFGGGGGGSTGDGEADPWDVGKVFGGTDDPDGPAEKRSSPTLSAPATARVRGAQGAQEEEEPLPSDAFDRVTEALGTTPALSAEERKGDARYQAVEGGLANPLLIGRRALSPEALIDRTGHLDPIGRPAAIGRFLSGAGTSLQARILGRVLAGPASGVLPACSGHAGAVARLAALAVAAEATEGTWEHTDRCVALSLVRDAWPDAVIAARKAAQTQRLIAPDILALALGTPAGPDARLPSKENQGSSVNTVRLGAAALERIIPEAHVPTIPPVRSHGTAPALAMDPNIAAADAALSHFTGGADPADLPPDPVLTQQAVGPLLDGATRLINALGRAQVEFAAAALAVERVRPGTPLRQTLIHGDRALRKLARSVVQSGDRLHKARGKPLHSLGTMPQQTHAQLLATAEALRGLRSWAMSALAQGISQ